jgi:peptidoglycan/xylan/chitin deacetylase (PgdA/CDA1 family)
MKWLFRALSGRHAERRLTILMFHRVTPVPDELFPGEVHRESFDLICNWVSHWFSVLPLDEAVRRIYDGDLPPRALAITFDDGYADNHDVALPILQRHGLNATFFVATGFLDGGRMWNDTLVESIRRAKVDSLDLRGEFLLANNPGVLSLRTTEERRSALQKLIASTKYLAPSARQAQVDRIAEMTDADLPRDLMMSSDQVARLHQAGMRIGAHTISHPILRGLSDDLAREEICGSRERLAQITGGSIDLFAYPNGKPGSDYGSRDAELVRQLGFLAAFSTSPGPATMHSGRFELPRYTPWRRTRLGFAAQLAHNLRQELTAPASGAA